MLEVNYLIIIVVVILLGISTISIVKIQRMKKWSGAMEDKLNAAEDALQNQKEVVRENRALISALRDERRISASLLHGNMFLPELRRAFNSLVEDQLQRRIGFQDDMPNFESPEVSLENAIAALKGIQVEKPHHVEKMRQKTVALYSSWIAIEGDDKYLNSKEIQGRLLMLSVVDR